MTEPQRPEPASLAMIERLIAMDTTSRNSNLELIHDVRDYLAALGVESHLTFDESGEKANLHATLGPSDRGGIALSGHSDVVPVDGQDWTSMKPSSLGSCRLRASTAAWPTPPAALASAVLAASISPTRLRARPR